MISFGTPTKRCEIGSEHPEGPCDKRARYVLTDCGMGERLICETHHAVAQTLTVLGGELLPL